MQDSLFFLGHALPCLALYRLATQLQIAKGDVFGLYLRAAKAKVQCKLLLYMNSAPRTMKSNVTHGRMTRILNPDISQSEVDAVNYAIDNPSRDSMLMQNIQNFMLSGRPDTTGPQFPGLIRYGHRQYNHDLLSAMITGYMQALIS